MHVNEQLVPQERLELSLYALEGRCFIQLSYWGKYGFLGEEAIPIYPVHEPCLVPPTSRLRIYYVLGAGIEPARQCLGNRF